MEVKSDDRPESNLDRQFQGFHSTLDRLKTFADFDNPKVYDDPRYQKHGGSPAPKIFLPYPDYESLDYQNKHRGEFTACMGPRGKLLNESMDDQVGVYAGIPNGMCRNPSADSAAPELTLSSFRRFPAAPVWFPRAHRYRRSHLL